MQRFAGVGWLLAAALVLGCSGKDAGGLGTIKAGGKVTLDGSPVEGAVVTFHPQAKGPSAIGKTDSQGQFTLVTTAKASGVMPGDYKVSIAKERAEGGLTPQQAEEYFKQGKVAPTPKVIDELPVKYKNPASSGLTAKVAPSGTNDFSFELKK